jgi:hypothetical protein
MGSSMRKRRYILHGVAYTLTALSFFCSCSTKTQVHKKQIESPSLASQTKGFQNYTMRAKDPKKAMKAIVSVLQNSGFIVTNCSTDLGVITAKKEIDIEKSGDRSFRELIDGPQCRWAKLRIIDTTIDILEEGDSVNLKAIFQQKDLDNRGAALGVDSIDDQMFYRDFFTKVEAIASQIVQIPNMK